MSAPPAPRIALVSPRLFPGAVFVLLVVTVVAFSPAIRGPQLFDDPAAIDENQSITRLWPPSVPLSPPAQSPVAGRPVANLTLALDHAINRALGVDQRADPEGPSKTIAYHLTNILLHLGSGLLLLGLVRRTLRHRRGSSMLAADVEGLALFVSAVWLLHPLQTEAVNYLAQRTELLVSFFFLTTLYCSVRAWESTPTVARTAWYVAGALACLLGMGSKEVMVSAPLMVLLYDRAFLLRSWRELLLPEYRARRWFYAGLFSTLLLLMLLVAAAPRSTSAGFHAGLSWQSYLVSQGWAVPHYLRLLFWPSGLSLDYGMQPVALGRALPGLLLLVVLGAATVLAWTRIERRGWLAFCGAWFFLLLAPSSSVVPIATEIAAERRVYLASAAVFVVLAIVADQLARRHLPSKTRPLLAVACVAVLAVGTFQRSRLHRDPEAIWRDALHKVPDNPRAMTNLGVALINAKAPKRAEADSLFHRAVALDSSYTTAWYNLAAIALQEHRGADEATALRHVLASRPHDVPALMALGQVEMATGHADSAEAAFRRVLAATPDRVDALDFLGAILVESGRPDSAAEYLERAVRLDPTTGMGFALLGLAEARRGHQPQAISNATRAIDAGGSDARVFYFAGRALLAAGRPDLAAPPLREMVRLGYRNADALALLAAVEARLGRSGSPARPPQ